MQSLVLITVIVSNGVPIDNSTRRKNSSYYLIIYESICLFCTFHIGWCLVIACGYFLTRWRLQLFVVPSWLKMYCFEMELRFESAFCIMYVNGRDSSMCSVYQSNFSSPQYFFCWPWFPQPKVNPVYWFRKPTVMWRYFSICACVTNNLNAYFQDVTCMHTFGNVCTHKEILIIFAEIKLEPY